MEKKLKELFFSVELKSRFNLKNVNLTQGSRENVLIEGSIGELLHAEFVEGTVLEVTGDTGVLRINLSPCEIKKDEKNEVTAVEEYVHDKKR